MANEPEKIDPETANWNEIQALIKQRYPTLSKRLQQVAAYVLDNPQMVAFETIAVIAAQIQVPPSTLIRFATALDLSGFNDLKNIVKEDLLEHTVNYSNRIQLLRNHNDWHGDDMLTRFAEANRQSLLYLEETTSKEDIRKAVEMMSQAKHIFILGNGRAHTVATYLHYTLNHIDKKAFLISGTGNMFHEQMSNVERGDLLFAISYTPYSSNTCDLAARAADRGVSVLSITDSPLSPLANTSQLSFVIHEARVDAFRSLSGSLLIAQILAISLADYQSPSLRENEESLPQQ